MQRPRRPGRLADAEAWQDYKRDMEQWQRQRGGRSGWTPGGSVDNEPALTRQEGDRVEALWGGLGSPDGPGHGHIVSNDGINAASMRYPGEEQAFFDNPEDKRQR